MRVINKGKNRIMIILAIMMVTGGLMAQPQHQDRPPAPPDSEQIEHLLSELKTLLSLTEVQSVQLSDLYRSHFSEMKEMMEKQNGNREDHHLAMDALKKKLEIGVNALLNDEQKAEYAEFLKHHSPKSDRKRPGKK